MECRSRIRLPQSQPGKHPAQQSAAPALQRTRHELQVHVAADEPFDGFGNLPVQSSLKPRYGKTVRYEDCRCCLCYRKERCSGKPICCLTQWQVFFDLFSGVLPDSLLLSVCFFFFFLLCIVLSVMSGGVLFPPGGYVLLALNNFSGHMLLWLSGYVLCSLIFFSGYVLWPLNPCNHLIEFLPDHLE